MGCCFSGPNDYSGKAGGDGGGDGVVYRRPKWQADPPMTRAELTAKREEFWHTQPAYGGSKLVWDTLKGALEAEHSTTVMLLEAAEIIVARKDMSEIYDSRGNRYELPPYVLSEPSNLLEGPQSPPTSPGGVQLAQRQP